MCPWFVTHCPTLAEVAVGSDWKSCSEFWNPGPFANDFDPSHRCVEAKFGLGIAQ